MNLPYRFEKILYRFEKTLYAFGLRSARELPRPDFLGIGAQKAGTTWLWANLRSHPQLFLPETKEIHFFDYDFYTTSLASYLTRFSGAGDRKAGEVTPAYGHLPVARIRFIRRVMPDVRLVLLLRHPADRAWSQAVMNLVKRPGRRPETVSDDDFIAHIRSPRSVRRGDYAAIIDSWSSVFGREQIYVGMFDRIATEPEALLREIFDHIGVSSDGIRWDEFPLRERWNEGPFVPIPPRVAAVLDEMYAREIDVLRARFGVPTLWSRTPTARAAPP